MSVPHAPSMYQHGPATAAQRERFERDFPELAAVEHQRSVILYHGTSHRLRRSIERSGFAKYTWLSTDKEDAKDFGELSARERGTVDIWQVEVPRQELEKVAWQLGSKRGSFYKLHHKLQERPTLIDTYDWDLQSMSQRPGKILS
jgi:hypothetical protein